MEASSSFGYTIVREALDENNYEMWSSYMEDYLLGQDLWDVIVEPQPEQAGDQETEIIIKTWKKRNALALHAIKMSCGPKLASTIVKVKSAKEAWEILAAAAEDSKEEEQLPISDSDSKIDYEPLLKAVRAKNWYDMERFLNSYPEAATAKVFDDDGTLFHYLLDNKQVNNATYLLNWMKADDLEISNGSGHTALAFAANKCYPGKEWLLDGIVKKNPKLPNIGTPSTLPVTIAAFNGFMDTTCYLYSVTDKSVLDPTNGKHGVSLLINCIKSKIFDIASKLVEEFPMILCQTDDDSVEENDKDPECPIHVLAKKFCDLSDENGPHNEWSDDEAWIYDEAHDFLKQVCEKVSKFNFETLVKFVYRAMVEAAIRENIDFINTMIVYNQDLIWARHDNQSMFWHAVKNRHVELFSLIYIKALEQKHTLLSGRNEENDNILHLVAKLPPPFKLLRISTSLTLQIQSEVMWFKELWNLANPRDREELNKEGLTPRQLFQQSHKSLIKEGEILMKDTAQSCTVVGALIVTMMFAAAFTVPGGNNSDTGYPLFVREVLFKIFISCDALSLSSATTSILVFLEILTSRYNEDDFLFRLPRKSMMGLFFLLFSITTMMVTFCMADSIMLDGRLQFILPISLLACIPVVVFLSSLRSKINMFKFGASIFDKNTKLSERINWDAMNNASNVPSNNVVSELPDTKEDEEIMNNNSSNVDQKV